MYFTWIHWLYTHWCLLCNYILFLFSRLSDLGYLYDSGGGGDQGGGGTVVANMDPITEQAFERRIIKLEQENKELSRKLQGLLFMNVYM